ncbi:hypothetical protein Ahy_B04g072982 isoform A [Arachis hypogaea]|uniref:HMG box domain-containing protein n=1 Tax=Arachis hypogaea TaxID=3818 RepID=A0A444ZP91_ARAHY|nr:hypothetical protein Ahy_B04g072982 isoform A [Arachis hypogaea]
MTKGKGTVRIPKEVLKAVDDRKVGKRKAAAKPDKSSARSKKAKKDPNKPKRPPSAFFVFLFVSKSLSLCYFKLLLISSFREPSDYLLLCDSEEFRKTFKAENPHVKAVSAVGKAGGEKWKSMSPAEKATYEAKAQKRKAEYEKQMNAYNKKQPSSADDGDEESDKSKSEVHDDEEEGSAEEDHQEEDDDDDDDEEEEEDDDDDD